MNLEQRLTDALNKLAKWRTVFASWQLGTRSSGDPECQAIKDHREVTILMRAEINALTKIILENKICTQEKLQEILLEEAQYLDRSYEKRFPGFSTSFIGVHIDKKGQETMKNWPT